MQRVVAGALAGLAATGPMTAVMLGLHRCLPRAQRHPLPPYHITTQLARNAGVNDEMDEEVRTTATYIGHFGYGAVHGSLYGLLAARVKAPAVAKGIGFGMAVWAVSYLGWLPVAGLYRPATREASGRNWLMIVAHIVWGAILGVLTERLTAGTRNNLQYVYPRRRPQRESSERKPVLR